MQVQVRKLEGSWDLGYALHKHTLSSVYLGDDEYGHPRFDNTRSEPGEALYQLKYRGDWNQIAPLAAQIQATLLPLFGKIGLIIPMPASTTRARQRPVDALEPIEITAENARRRPGDERRQRHQHEAEAHALGEPRRVRRLPLRRRAEQGSYGGAEQPRDGRALHATGDAEREQRRLQDEQADGEWPGRREQRGGKQEGGEDCGEPWAARVELSAHGDTSGRAGRREGTTAADRLRLVY